MTIQKRLDLIAVLPSPVAVYMLFNIFNNVMVKQNYFLFSLEVMSK